MKPIMYMYFDVSSSITLLISFLLTIHLIPTIESISSPDSTVVDDYIQKCCNVTLYQSLCCSTLSGQYTGPVDDLGGLTLAALGISLTEATSVSNYVASVNQSQTGPAVQDCVKLARATVGQLHQSFSLLAKVTDAYVASGGAYNETEKGKMRFELSSVQTWMSAGITNEHTCMQGFKDVGVKNDGDQVERRVYVKVWRVIKLISNALALVNSYVDGLP